MTDEGPSLADGVRWLGTRRVTLGIILLLFVVFVLEQVVWATYGLDAVAYIFAAGPRPTPGWILAPFSHATVLHLVTSATVVLVYGSLVESVLDAATWFRFYVLAGYVATMAQVAAYWLGEPGSATLGASGAGLAVTTFYALTSLSHRRRDGHWREADDGVLTVAAVAMVAVLLVNDFSGATLVTGTAPYGHLGGVVSGVAFAWWR